MNEWERNRRMAERYRESHPPGTRIMLLSTSETMQPVPLGMKGTVDFIDDQSQIHMKWDNGRTLAVIPGEDSFRKLTAEELAEEQKQNMDEAHSPVMGMWGVGCLEITIPEMLIEPLLIQASEQEVSVEEIVETVIKKYLERNENIVHWRKERNYC